MIKPQILACLLSLFAPWISADTAKANTALQHGRVGEAETLLRSILSTSPNDAHAHQLLCRVFYSQEQPDRAIPECEAANSLSPNESENLLWLGRAYGQKAEHANPLAAYSLARKLRNAFERAAEIKPVNVVAVSALGQFYVSAPSVVGGGVNKARRLASTLQSQAPAQSHRLLALAANATNDLKTAEAEFRLAIASAPTADAYMDLALFYQTHNRPDQALETVRLGIAADPAHGPALFDAASILNDAQRAPELAEKALRDYMNGGSQSDEAPVFKAHLQLGKLLAKHGDVAGAKREYAEALALAPNYGPARDALKGA